MNPIGSEHESLAASFVSGISSYSVLSLEARIASSKRRRNRLIRNMERQPDSNPKNKVSMSSESVLHGDQAGSRGGERTWTVRV